jgi:hypothetical protein
MLDYLKQGVFAGGIAGVAYGLFMAFVANPLTESLHQLAHDHGHEAGESAAIVTESTTAIVSIGGGLLWAIFLGGVFGLAMFVFEPALPGPNSVRSYVLAGCGFLTVSVTPWLVVPPATPLSEQLYSVDIRLAIYGGLVLVGAVDHDTRRLRGYSSQGPTVDGRLKPDVVAPDGVSTDAGCCFHGTSAAAPHAAGVAALALSANATLSPDALRTALRRTTTTVRDGEPVPATGWGLVNATGAVAAVGTSDTDEYTAFLDSVATLLKAPGLNERQVRAEGHTDDIPTDNFGSNWQISALRATNVVEVLTGEYSVEPSRLSAVGFGPHRPVASNDTPEGRAENRRVEIVIMRDDVETNEQ